MTEIEKTEIINAVIDALNDNSTNYDDKVVEPYADDVVLIMRKEGDARVGKCVTWEGLCETITASAKNYAEASGQSATTAEEAKNAANTILTQVQSKGTEITNFVATSKTEIETQKNESVKAVKSVYQTDLDELKGDLVNHYLKIKEEFLTSTIKNGYFDGDTIVEGSTKHGATVSYVDVPKELKIKYTGEEFKYSVYWYNFTTNKWISNGTFYEEDRDLSPWIGGTSDWVNNGKVRIKFLIMKKDESAFSFSTLMLKDVVSITQNIPITSDKLADESIGPEKLTEECKRNLFLDGIVENVSGSYVKKYTGNFSPQKSYRIKLVEKNPDDGNALNFHGMTDVNDTNNMSWQFAIKTGETYLWTPTSNFVALYWAVNGSYKVEITDATSYTDNLACGKVFYCGANRELNTLVKGIKKAEEFMDSVLYVDDGTYDIFEELGGSSYFDNFKETSEPGIFLKNRIHVIFSSNSKVVYNYQGTNQYALSLFSVFNVGEFGFTLENANIVCKNLRYAVHDERNGSKEQCITRYKNCKFDIDNSNNPNCSNSCPIGGGLGSNHEVDFDGCVFKSVPTSRQAIYYHASNKYSEPRFRSTITIRNCYMVNGTVYLDDLGRNDNYMNSEVIVTNNSFAPVVSSDENGMVTENLTGNVFNLRVWNNVIRTN